MQRFRDFLKRKDIEISLRRYGIDALGAMAQGLFCSLLIGTILNTLGQQFHIGFLNAIIFTLGKGDAAVGYTIGGCASLMVGPAMAVAIGYALHAPAMVLFSLVPVGYATNAMGGAGGPLAVASGVFIMACFYAFRTPIRRQRDKEYRRPSNHAGKALKFQSFSGSKCVGWRAVWT